MRRTLEDLLESHPVVLTDGATGTTLFSAGLIQGEPPESWNLERPDVILGLHRDYIHAGSQVILTNSFGGTHLRLSLHGLAERAREINRVAAELAGSEAAAAEQGVVVAGSMGPCGGILEPYGELSLEQVRDAFEEQAGALAEGGADVFWIETMSDLGEVRAAVAGARNAAPEIPVVVTMTFDTAGHTMMGVSPEQAISALMELGLLAAGGNCGNGPAEVETVIEKMHAEAPEAILVAKSNAGRPRLEAGSVVYDATPESMAIHAVRVRDLGARVIGACCGSTPDHLQAMAGALGLAPGMP